MYPAYIAPATAPPITNIKSANLIIQRPFPLVFSAGGGGVGSTGAGSGVACGCDGGGGSGNGGW